MFKLETVVMSA